MVFVISGEIKSSNNLCFSVFICVKGTKGKGYKGPPVQLRKTLHHHGYHRQYMSSRKWRKLYSVINSGIVVVVVSHCFTSLLGTNGLLSDIVIR